jgi:hypothetical protein
MLLVGLYGCRISDELQSGVAVMHCAHCSPCLGSDCVRGGPECVCTHMYTNCVVCCFSSCSDAPLGTAPAAGSPRATPPAARHSLLSRAPRCLSPYSMHMQYLPIQHTACCANPSLSLTIHHAHTVSIHTAHSLLSRAPCCPLTIQQFHSQAHAHHLCCPTVQVHQGPRQVGGSIQQRAPRGIQHTGHEGLWVCSV